MMSDIMMDLISYWRMLPKVAQSKMKCRKLVTIIKCNSAVGTHFVYLGFFKHANYFITRDAEFGRCV